MADIVENVRQLLVSYTAIQRLGIYVAFSTTCSLFLSSSNPLIWFLITLTLSWILVQCIGKLSHHVPEKYMFKLLDAIDEVEFIFKKFILRDAKFIKAKSVSSVVSDNPVIDPNEELACHGDTFNAPENEARICIQYIVRDFINSWYKEYISAENQPIEEAQEILEQLTIQAFDRFKKVEIIPFVKLIIARFQKHIADYKNAQEYWQKQPYLRSKRNREQPEFKKVKNVIRAFQSMGKFHPAMRSKMTELEYLRSAVKIVMKTSIPNEAYKCDAARELLLEILTQNILKSLVDLFSDAFWLHKVMVLILTDKFVEIIDDTSTSVNQASVADISVAISAGGVMQSGPVINESDITNSSVQPAIGSNISNELGLKGENDEVKVNAGTSTESTETTERILDVPETAASLEPDQCSTGEEFKPKFFVGDFDTISNHSIESDTSETLQRVAPEGCSPPKDYNSASSTLSPQALTTFENIPEEDSDVVQCATLTEDNFKIERKEIYKTRNRKWNPQDDRIIPSPLTLLTDASTYQETIDISNANTTIPSIHSAPNFQTLKIDYGPDISNIDPAALIKETPRILFAGVHIPETDMAKEPGTAGNYTLYCIEYVAWHFLPSIGRWTQQPGSVKRRYREFATLQDRLQDHPVYRKSIKEEKGPNRWRVKPLGQLHEKTVENRRRFLEQYLQILSKKEDVGTSFALKEFLAYEADTRIAFVKKAPEMPRLDKMIVRTFSGVMNKIATMPGAIHEADRPVSPEVTEGHLGTEVNAVLLEGDSLSQDDDDKFRIEYDLWYPEEQDEAYNNIESIIWKTTYLTDSKAAHLYSECETTSTSDSEFYDPVDFTPITSPRPEGDGCDKDQLDQCPGPSDADIPLTVKIFELAVQLAEGREAWVCHENALHMFKTVIGRALDRFITHEIDELTSSSRCATYINKLKETLWPDGELDSTEEKSPSEEQKSHTRAQARQALYDFLPAAVPVIVGLDDFNHCLDVIMQCIDHPELNRTFAFTLVDLIVETAFPEIKTGSLQQQLLSCSGDESVIH